MKQAVKLTVLAGALSVLTGCAATQTAISHGSLQVSTKQSETIFLDPVANSQKTIFVAVKNTSDQEVEVASKLKDALKRNGYKIVASPNAAHYMLQANILTVAKMSHSASEGALGAGYGSAIAGAAVGTAVGSFANSTAGMVGGGIAGGVIGLAADALVKDVNYTMITDLQISARVGKGIKVNEHFQSNLQNGSSTVNSQSYVTNSEYQRYRTRVVSNADKVNLKFAEARPALEQGLAKVIAGIF